MLLISDIQNVCHDNCIAITKHAKNRLFERNITVDDIKHAILHGVIIKQYEDDKPFPSCLILGYDIKSAPIHIVASINDNFLYIITSYKPDPSDWENEYKTRKDTNRL